MGQIYSSSAIAEVLTVVSQATEVQSSASVAEILTVLAESAEVQSSASIAEILTILVQDEGISRIHKQGLLVYDTDFQGHLFDDIMAKGIDVVQYRRRKRRKRRKKNK